ncbi:MAG: hypothetical protein WKF40_06495 [Thermoleophilaceae bacterium]
MDPHRVGVRLVEAVAFAAAGLLFGSTVNRQRAEQAEQKANANQKDAEGGRRSPRR